MPAWKNGAPISFRSSGPIPTPVSVTRSTSRAPSTCAATVTGVGIGPEDLKLIGAPFFQAGKTYQRRHEGTGLGLSIVKSLVALHSGELKVQSKVGEGTMVTVAMPLVFEKPQTLQPASKIAMLTPAVRQAVQETAVQPTVQVKTNVKKSA